MRLIDADALKLDYEKSARNDNHIKEGASAVHMQEHRHILHILDKQPTIDAVPVIRCKNCKHYEMGVCLKIYQDGNVSNDAWQERKPTDFCSYGERKE